MCSGVVPRLLAVSALARWKEKQLVIGIKYTKKLYNRCTAKHRWHWSMKYVRCISGDIEWFPGYGWRPLHEEECFHCRKNTVMDYYHPLRHSSTVPQGLEHLQFCTEHVHSLVCNQIPYGQRIENVRLLENQRWKIFEYSFDWQLCTRISTLCFLILGEKLLSNL